MQEDPLYPASVLDHWDKLEDQDLVDILKRRFEIERVSEHFELVNDHFYQSNLIKVDASNSILLRFETLQNEYPDDYDSLHYNLLFLLSLRKKKHIPDKLRLELQNVARKENVDKTILWTCRDLPNSVVQSLKPSGIDILSIRPREIRKVRSISHFIPWNNPDYDYNIALNLVADLLLKRLKKLFHLVLSEIAAPIYDSLYAKDKIATRALMQFEENLIRGVSENLKKAGRNRKAVDIGCGTGRHTFHLAESFDDVYGFDFSPRMIEQAKQEKRKQGWRSVLLSVADIEYEEVMDERSFTDGGEGLIDCVVASFGMGSFVEDTPQLLRRIYSWLADDGYLVISFYNPDSILLKVTPNWRDTALSAHFDPSTSTLRVEVTPDTIFHIYCKPYSEEVQAAVGALFEIENVVSFPTLMALMPNSLLADKTARELFLALDKRLARDDRFEFGYYITVVARKRAVRIDAYQRVTTILDETGADYRVIEHLPVLSVGDVREEIGDKPGAMIKTVIFRDKSSGRLVIVVLPAERRVNKKRLASAIGYIPQKLVFAPEREILELGFPLGGVAPFGYPEDLDAVFLVDSSVMKLRKKWLFTGIGDNQKTLKIRAVDLRKIIGGYRRVDVLHR